MFLLCTRKSDVRLTTSWDGVRSKFLKWKWHMEGSLHHQHILRLHKNDYNYLSVNPNSTSSFNPLLTLIPYIVGAHHFRWTNVTRSWVLSLLDNAIKFQAEDWIGVSQNEELVTYFQLRHHLQDLYWVRSSSRIFQESRLYLPNSVMTWHK